MTTINDIARLAGVSKSTVSRVITNPSIVRKTTREKVLAVMKECHFVPNSNAQSLSGAPSKTIGVIIDEISNFFFVEIIEGAQECLAEKGYSLMIYSSQWIEEKEKKQAEILISKRISGVLLSPLSTDSPAIQMFRDAGIPTVVVNCIPDDPDCEYVTCDNVRGGELVADHINKTDSEQVILICGFPHQTISDRVKGFRGRLSKEKTLVAYSDISTYEKGRALVPLLIRKNHIDKVKTALFFTNDNVAVGALDTIRDCGLDVPSQVSVYGFDDTQMAQMKCVSLSTVHQDGKKMGFLATDQLIDLIENPNHVPHNSILAPKLIIRGSSL